MLQIEVEVGWVGCRWKQTCKNTESCQHGSPRKDWPELLVGVCRNRKTLHKHTVDLEASKRLRLNGKWMTCHTGTLSHVTMTPSRITSKIWHSSKPTNWPTRSSIELNWNQTSTYMLFQWLDTIPTMSLQAKPRECKHLLMASSCWRQVILAVPSPE